MGKFLRGLFRVVVIVVAVVIVLALVVLAGFVVYRAYQRDPPRIENLDERLPLFFHFGRLWVVWVWIVGLQGAAVALGYWVWRRTRGFRASPQAPEPGELLGPSPELDQAWKEIEVRSGRGLTDRVYLMLAPSEEHADALLDASGLAIESRVPRARSFVRASMASGATFLTCVARPPQVEPEAAAAPSSVEYVCERLRAAGGDGGRARGVVAILPVDWLGRADVPKLATAYRGDLQAIGRILNVRPPLYVVVTGMETEPGFLEFARRMTETFRTRRRCGFYLPGEPVDVSSLVHGGLVWFSGWYQTWMLYLMAQSPLNHSGNNALFLLGGRIRGFRRRLPELIGTITAAPQGGENIPLYGCYFAATGHEPGTAACAGGIVRGRLLENSAATRWAARALEDDLAYRRAAVAVGLTGGIGAILVWAYIALAIGSLSWLGLAVPAGLVGAWIVTLLQVRTRTEP